jgi:hypothetical protein
MEFHPDRSFEIWPPDTWQFGSGTRRFEIPIVW